MPLLNRGRLSVQRVEQAAWDAVKTMADKGGWSEGPAKKTRSRKKRMPDENEDGEEPSPKESVEAKGNPRKRKAQQAEGGEGSAPVRRSTRTRTKR
jgi:protein phosphatase-4 regulatory subunit 3